MSEKIYDTAFAEPDDRLEAYADFVAIIKQLRRDCPWDREQTHESVKHLLIEEAYETVEAIDEEDWDELKKELGDLLLHVVFHSVIAEQDGRFTLKDVIEAETDKLVRRHPHVFGETEVEGVGQVLSNWEQIKMQERGASGETRKSVLEGVPSQLPALLRAYRVQEKAAGVGFDFPEQAGAWEKVEEEIAEFHALAEADASDQRKEEEFGDLLFGLVNYARFVGINPENALRRTNAKFGRRFQHIEQRLAEQGLTMAEVDLAEMDRFWDEAKRLETGNNGEG
jgi:XTP/dITP diphosphohydrolase/tetrapyrrole methylase family protein/MazG family protein